MIKELDVVTLTHDIEEHGLEKGSQGAVVHCYEGGEGFEVEFIDPPHVLTLAKADIELDRVFLQAEVTELLGSLPEEGLIQVRNLAESLRQRQVRKVG